MGASEEPVRADFAFPWSHGRMTMLLSVALGQTVLDSRVGGAPKNAVAPSGSGTRNSSARTPRLRELTRREIPFDLPSHSFDGLAGIDVLARPMQGEQA
jgi:hypothetical protein